MDDTGKYKAISRDEIREMVEQHWRLTLTHAAMGNMTRGVELIEEFEAAVLRKAASMPENEGNRFLAVVQEERGRIADEYTLNPAALKRRLGLTAQPQARAPHSSPQSSIGNTIVRTAVRATVWESVWALFRLFR